MNVPPPPPIPCGNDEIKIEESSPKEEDDILETIDRWIDVEQFHDAKLLTFWKANVPTILQKGPQ